MRDPFVILRAELVDAAERAAQPARRKRWGRLRRPSRPVVILLVALVIAGSAAAAVLSLSASQPLVGRVPGAITPASVAGYGYTIASDPRRYQSAGRWGGMAIRGSSTAGRAPAGMSGRERGSAPAIRGPRTPIFGGGSGLIFGGGSGPTSFARGDTVAYVLTGPQVWAVRIGSRTIRTVSSRSLPVGDRAAVFFVPAKGPVPVFLMPGFPAPRMKSIPAVAIVPLDRFGRAIATEPVARLPPKHRP